RKAMPFSCARDAHLAALPSHWEHLQSTGIYVMKPDGTGLRRVTRPGGVAGSPACWADGKRILFYETDEVWAYLSKFAPVRSEIASVDALTGERKVHPASNE